MKLLRIKIIALLGIALIFVSCNQGSEIETAAAESQPTSIPTVADSGYPAPLSEPTEDSGYPPPVIIPTIAGYPAPNSDVEVELYATAGPVPEASSSSGVVVGVIQVNNEPIPNLTIYLAEVLNDGEGLERVASYDRVNSPRAFTNEEGEYVFSNILPGRYGLVLDIVLSAYLLHLPQEDTALIITVEAGQVTEIELLDYDSLPLPDVGE
jgi:hypothetical protein